MRRNTFRHLKKYKICTYIFAYIHPAHLILSVPLVYLFYNPKKENILHRKKMVAHQVFLVHIISVCIFILIAVKILTRFKFNIFYIKSVR